MKPLLLFAFLFLINNASFAQKQEHYSRAKIYLDASGHTINDLSATGIAVDHGEHKRNTFFIADFSDSELARVKKAGFKVDIIIDDVVKHYQEQNKKKAKKTTASCNSTPKVGVPAHFHLGSYAGGYFSYTEMLNILDSMQLLYPGIISVRQPISTFLTYEGRPIYWVRISNNPSVDQPLKPQMLYTALHHAREPGSLSATIFYLWYLLEHYSTDPQIKTIIDNTELYFVPCVNPDGYIDNVTKRPLGGGMLRKNKRNNMDGTYGVDLNRNYGKFWGFDDIGSSPITSSDTYRGLSGFSEPETQAIKWLAENHNFRISLNYHTYQNDIIYPWGHIPSYLTDDSSQFFAYGEFLTKENHYNFGTGNQLLNYVTNGDSDDWMYGDVTSKNKVFSMTPEIGSVDYGFYPPTSLIIPDCQNNLPANIKAASLLLPFASISHTDKKILIASSGYLHYSLQRIGFMDGATYTASIIPLDSWLTVSSAPKVYTGLSMLQRVYDSIGYTLSPGITNGQLVSYVLQLNNGMYNIYDTVQFYYGKHYAITEPSTNSITDWTNSGWGLATGSYHSAPASIQSSATGTDNYSDGAVITIATASPADLTLSKQAYLNFYTKWAVEPGYDQVTVSAGVAGSGYWQPLCGQYTKIQPGSGVQMYDGLQPAWVQEEIDLSDFIGKKINIRFELSSDAQGNYSGFYFDDLSITSIEDIPNTVKNIEKAGSAPINIYPNPSHNTFAIMIPGQLPGQELTAVLYDYAGRAVMHFNINSKTTTVDTKQLPPNVYYLKTFSNNTVFPVQKIVVE